MNTKKRCRLSFSMLAVLLLAAACFSSLAPKAQQVLYNISGNASGAQAVPAVTGNGSGTIKGTYNPSTKILDYYATWNDLTGAPTSAGFYTGAPGVNGNPFGDPWALGTNNRTTGHTVGQLTLTEAQEKELLAGTWYYSYSTLVNANGEIRGQITANQ